MTTFLQDTKFFFTGFHSWKINIIFHLVSLGVFTLGVYQRNIIFFILGLAVIDELGHIYNFYILHKGNPDYNPVRMLPYQVIFVLLPAFIIFCIFFV